MYSTLCSYHQGFIFPYQDKKQGSDKFKFIVDNESTRNFFLLFKLEFGILTSGIVSFLIEELTEKKISDQFLSAIYATVSRLV